MTIELHINGVFTRAWILTDIREASTEKGGQLWQKKVMREVNDIKMDLYWLLEFNEYEFFVVYESEANELKITSSQMIEFEKKIKVKQVDRIIRKYGRAS